MIDLVSAEIEQAVQKRTLEALPALCAHMDQLQEEVKNCIGEVLDLLRRQKDLKGCAEMETLLVLMQRIEARNRQMMPQVQSIMAVQRNELRTLQRGNTVLQGYRPGFIQTGRRISSSG
jgi:hypothetical protein